MPITRVLTPEDQLELSYDVFKFHTTQLSSTLITKRVKFPRRNGNICWGTVSLYCHKGQSILQNIFIYTISEVITSNEYIEPVFPASDVTNSSLGKYDVMIVIIDKELTNPA